MERKKIKLSKGALFGESRSRKSKSLDDNPLIEKAAVLNRFTIEEAKTWMDTDKIQQHIQELKANSQVVGEGEKDLWYSLNNKTRKKYLGKILAEGALQKQLDFFKGRPPSDDTSLFALQFLNKKSKPIETQDLEELALSLHLAKWVDKFDLGYPKPRDIYAEMRKKEFLKPLQELTQNFQGRKKELNRIQNYVDWLPKTNVLQKTESLVRKAFSWYSKNPLLISGIGGIGKSTLVAKFILNHLEDSNKLPFVFIDFDNPSYSISEPLFFLLESFKQLKIQFPHLNELFNKFIEILDDEVFNERRLETQEKSSPSFRRKIYAALARKLQTRDLDLSMIDRPVLVVLDSFEELQYRGVNRSEYYNFLDTIKEISEWIPRIRPVFIGRAEVEFNEIEFETISLKSFDRKSADGYLEKLGVSNKSLRKKIFYNFGGNPLSLQLAAALAKEQGLAKTERLSAVKTGFFFRTLDESVIQKELVKRNLDHIHDADVRKIALPGLLVRRVNAGIIREVLAEPCGLGKISREKAEAIYELLQKETFLIQSNQTSKGVVFRQELRRAMEEMVIKKDPENARLIHEKAIAYYEKKESAENQAEYIYHRLKRGDKPHFLSTKKYNSISQYLDRSLEELPLNAQVYIAGLRGSKISEEKLLKVKIEEWESYYVKVIQNSLRGTFHSLEITWQELKLREERIFNSPLHYWEARLYQRLNNIGKSNKIINKALRELNPDTTGAKELRSRLKILKIENLEYRYDFKEAYQELKRLLKVLPPKSTPLILFQLEILNTRLTARLNIKNKKLWYVKDTNALFVGKHSYKYYQSYYLTSSFDGKFPFNTLKEKAYKKAQAEFQASYKDLESLEDFCSQYLGNSLAGLTEPGAYPIVLDDVFNRSNENILARINTENKTSNIEGLAKNLAQLYPSTNAAKRALRAANIYAKHISFKHSTIQNWLNILVQLQRSGDLENLLEQVRKDYPNNEYLQKKAAKPSSIIRNKKLLKRLAELYPTIGDTLRLLAFTTISEANIDFSTDALKNWGNIITEAEAQDQLTELFQAIADEQEGDRLLYYLKEEPSIELMKDASIAYDSELFFDKQKLKKLLISGRLEEALTKVELIAKDLGIDFEGEVQLLRYWLMNLQEEQQEDTIKQGEYSLEINRITSHLFDLIDSIEMETKKEIFSFGKSMPKARGLKVPGKKAFRRAIGSDDKVVPTKWLSGAMKAAKAVCKVEGTKGMGTGFLLKGGYVLTTHHLICNAFAKGKDSCDLDEVSKVRICLGFEDEKNSGVWYKLNPSQTFIADKELDYALIKVKDNTLKPIAEWGYAEIESSKIPQINDLVNIIHHPEGKTKKIVLPDRVISVWPEKNHLFYLADTRPGSGGAPVFNQDWKIVALHQAGSGKEQGSLQINAEGDRLAAKRGTLIRAIIKDLEPKGFKKF